MDKYTHATSPIRRIVDLVNQALFHKSFHLVSNDIKNLDTINKFNLTLKKFYRKRDKLLLASTLSSELYQTFSGYIYDHGDNVIYVYLDELNISFTYKIYSKSPIYMVNYILYIDFEYKDEFIEIPYQKKIQLELLGYPDIFNIDDSIKIKLNKTIL